MRNQARILEETFNFYTTDICIKQDGELNLEVILQRTDFPNFKGVLHP